MGEYSLLYFIITWVLIGFTIFWQLLLLRRLGITISESISEFANAFNESVSSFGEILENPVVKRALSITGKMGGDRKSVNSIKNRIAQGFIDQNLGVYKMIGEKALGINIDDILEEYGAENIITAINELAPKIGLDLSSIAQNTLEGLNMPGNKGNLRSSVPEMT